MSTVTTTRMSAKGQVVIPQEVRRRLRLRRGVRFVVVGEGDVVILKAVSPPSMSDFDALIARARRQAQRAGLRRSDVAAAVRKVRGQQ